MQCRLKVCRYVSTVRYSLCVVSYKREFDCLSLWGDEKENMSAEMYTISTPVKYMLWCIRKSIPNINVPTIVKLRFPAKKLLHNRLVHLNHNLIYV